MKVFDNITEIVRDDMIYWKKEMFMCRWYRLRYDLDIVRLNHLGQVYRKQEDLTWER